MEMARLYSSELLSLLITDSHMEFSFYRYACTKKMSISKQCQVTQDAYIFCSGGQSLSYETQKQNMDADAYSNNEFLWNSTIASQRVVYTNHRTWRNTYGSVAGLDRHRWLLDGVECHATCFRSSVSEQFVHSNSIQTDASNIRIDK